MNRQYDVVVIGGGTGGAAIAKFLAKQGIKVALLEKKKFIDLHKVCGDAVSPYHFAAVSQSDPQYSVMPPQGKEIFHSFSGYYFYAPSMERFYVPSLQEGWIIDRQAFGARLLRMGKVKELYREYPESWNAFPEWKKKIAALFQDEKRAARYHFAMNRKRRA